VDRLLGHLINCKGIGIVTGVAAINGQFLYSCGKPIDNKQFTIQAGAFLRTPCQPWGGNASTVDAVFQSEVELVCPSSSYISLFELTDAGCKTAGDLRYRYVCSSFEPVATATGGGKHEDHATTTIIPDQTTGEDSGEEAELGDEFSVSEALTDGENTDNATHEQDATDDGGSGATDVNDRNMLNSRNTTDDHVGSSTAAVVATSTTTIFHRTTTRTDLEMPTSQTQPFDSDNPTTVSFNGETRDEWTNLKQILDPSMNGTVPTNPAEQTASNKGAILGVVGLIAVGLGVGLIYICMCRSKHTNNKSIRKGDGVYSPNTSIEGGDATEHEDVFNMSGVSKLDTSVISVNGVVYDLGNTYDNTTGGTDLTGKPELQWEDDGMKFGMWSPPQSPNFLASSGAKGVSTPTPHQQHAPAYANHELDALDAHTYEECDDHLNVGDNVRTKTGKTSNNARAIAGITTSKPRPGSVVYDVKHCPEDGQSSHTNPQLGNTDQDTDAAAPLELSKPPPVYSVPDQLKATKSRLLLRVTQRLPNDVHNVCAPTAEIINTDEVAALSTAVYTEPTDAIPASVRLAAGSSQLYPAPSDCLPSPITKSQPDKSSPAAALGGCGNGTGGIGNMISNTTNSGAVYRPVYSPIVPQPSKIALRLFPTASQHPKVNNQIQPATMQDTNTSLNIFQQETAAAANSYATLVRPTNFAMRGTIAAISNSSSTNINTNTNATSRYNPNQSPRRHASVAPSESYSVLAPHSARHQPAASSKHQSPTAGSTTILTLENSQLKAKVEAARLAHENDQLRAQLAAMAVDTRQHQAVANSNTPLPPPPLPRTLRPSQTMSPDGCIYESID
jgi:hypothetical protein